MFDEISRRQFVKLTGGFVVGAAAAGSTPLINVLTANAQNSTRYKIVGYFENWSQYRQGGGQFFPAQIDPSLYTHINFAFGIFGYISKGIDPNNPRLTGDYRIQPIEWNDQTVLYPEIQKLKQKNPNLKTLLSIGGWGFNDPQDPIQIGTYTYPLFSQMAASSAGRQQFINSAIEYAHKYGFDGIDLDWEYPAVTDRGGKPEDFDNFLTLLNEFRNAINSDSAGQKLLLTIASPAIPKGESKTSQEFFQWLAQCAGYLDWLNVMSYDYHGAFPDDKVTGVNAPLAEDSTPGGTFSVKNTVEAYLAAGIPTSKIILGMATYGRTFKVSSPLSLSDNGPGKTYSSAGNAGPATVTPGVLSYYEIQNLISSGSLTRQWHERTLTPYAYNTQTGDWVSYDDAESIGYKTSYLIEKKLGGAMIWAIGLDQFQNGFPLIKRAKSILDNPASRPVLPVALSQNLLIETDRHKKIKTDGDGVVGTTGAGGLAVFNGKLYCVHPGGGRGDDSSYLWYTVFDGNSWSQDQQLKTSDGGVVGTSDSPALAVFNDKLYCIHPGGGNDSIYLWYTVFDGNSWSQDQQLKTSDGGNVGTTGSPALAVFNGKLYCIHPGAILRDDDSNYLWYTVFDGNSWSQDQQLKTSDGGVVGTSDSPALAAFNGKLYCIHPGAGISPHHPNYLWYTVFDGNTWSQDQQLKTIDGGDVGTTGRAALAGSDDKLWCIHKGGGTGDDSNYLWHTILDGSTWSKDEVLTYPISANDFVKVNTSSPGALVIFNNQLLCAHEIDGFLWSLLLVKVNFITGSQLNWTQVKGSNSYLYYKLDSNDTNLNGFSVSERIKIEAGALYLLASIFKNTNSNDFPIGAKLTITSPDGTVYNRISNTENLIVIMSGSSLRGLAIKQPIAGDYIINLSVPGDVEFRFEIEALPSKNVFQTKSSAFSKTCSISSGNKQLLKQNSSCSSISISDSFFLTASILIMAANNNQQEASRPVVTAATGENTGTTDTINNLVNNRSETVEQLGEKLFNLAEENQRLSELINLRLITWNMQGANFEESGTGAWDAVFRWFYPQDNSSNYNLDVATLQEVGTPPPSATLVDHLANGVEVYRWNRGTNSRPQILYITFYPSQNGQGGRVNLAIVSRTRPANIRLIPGVNGLRPLLGIQINGLYVYCIHASASGGGDAVPLLQRAQQDSIDNEGYRWVVAGDFNVHPQNLNTRLTRANLRNMTINPPAGNTHPALNPQSQLDYAVLGRDADNLLGQVLDSNATFGAPRSDHLPVFFDFTQQKNIR